MKINQKISEKPIFYTRYSYFEYKVIFLKLFNRLASFQDYIYKILAKKLINFVIIYFGNILIYTKNQI